MKIYTAERRHSHVPVEISHLLGEHRAQNPFYVVARTLRDAEFYLAEAGFPHGTRNRLKKVPEIHDNNVLALAGPVVPRALQRAGLFTKAGALIVVGANNERLLRVTGHCTGELVGYLERPGLPGVVDVCLTR